jgi:hypothetical protein
MAQRALIALFLVIVASGGVVADQARAADRHAGYYYPPNITHETYNSRAIAMAEASRSARIQFVTTLTQQMLGKPHAPEFAIFAKGEHAEKLIVVGLQPGSMSTLYRARAVLAMLTSVARSSRLFNEFGVQDFFTFFDLAKLFGFVQITVTDGETFSHQIAIE